MNFTSLRTLEYEGMLAILARYLTSTLADERRPLLQPQFDLSTLRPEIRLVSELKKRTREGSRFNFSELKPLSEITAQLAIQGSVLEPLQIVELEKLIVAGERTRSLAPRLEEVYPSIAQALKSLPELRPLEKLLKGKILPTGELSDDASPTLDSIRKSIQKVNEKIQRLLMKMVQKDMRSGSLQDDVITIRNERFVIPVRVEQRKQVPGVFHGSSSSGATVFIEPLPVVDLNNELASLREAEQQEIRRILAWLSDQLRSSLPALESAAQILIDLDVAQAKALFSIDFDCCEPELNTEGTLTLEQARHPLLEDTLRRQSKSVVPISVDLNRGRNLLVISGPNTGGKTVALKTVGMAALMAQSGMHVAAQRAVLPIFNPFLADIGDLQSIQDSLSTFASHVTNIRTMAHEVRPSALVLIDEIGTGTDPVEGEALGIATADFFRKAGAFTIVTTHFTGLKIYASQTEGAVNASVEFDERTLQPTFRLIGGVAGASSGIEIASRLGLQEQIVEEARSRLSGTHLSMMEFLTQLKVEKTQLEDEQERLHDELEAAQREREKLSDNFTRQWKQKVEELDRRFVSSFRELESRALKAVDAIVETAKRTRAKAELQGEFRRMKERHIIEVKELSAGSPSTPVTDETPDFSPHVFRVGETVRLRQFNKEALLHKIDPNGAAEVLVGNFKMKVLLSDCEPCALKAPAPSKDTRAERARRDPHLKIDAEAAATSELNLIGFTVEEALESADKFLDQAFLADAPRVRIIHGTGMGVLKRSLSEMFAKHPQVERFYPAPREQGGNGVTIVELKL